MSIVRRRAPVACFLALLLTVVWGQAALAAAGGLDTTFGGDGKVLTNFTPRFDGANGIVIQPGGKVVAVGQAAGLNKFALARYNPNGSLDRTFGGDGRVTTFFQGGGAAAAVALQVGGKIVAGGEANGKFALARYNLDGTRDTSFGGDGRVTTSFTKHSGRANDVAVKHNGKIVAAGTFLAPTKNHPFDARFAVARYRADGTLDDTFSGNGKVLTNFTGAGDLASGVAVRPSGKIVAAGVAGEGEGLDVFDTTFALARYDADGSLDRAFGGDGKVTTNFTKAEDGASDIGIQDDGKIVAAGSAAGSGGRFALARYHPDGTRDHAFGGDGRVTTRFHGGGRAHAAAIQGDGKIVAAGAAGAGSSSTNDAKFALARYLAA